MFLSHYDDAEKNVYTEQKKLQRKELKKMIDKIHNDDLEIIEQVLSNFDSFKGFVNTLQTIAKIGA